MSGSRCRLVALDSSFARSHSCSSLLRALFAYTVDGDRRAPDLLRKSTESQPVSMARCRCFVRIGAECVGSRSELGEALAAADSSHRVTPPCSLTPSPRRSCIQEQAPTRLSQRARLTLNALSDRLTWPHRPGRSAVMLSARIRNVRRARTEAAFEASKSPSGGRGYRAGGGKRFHALGGHLPFSASPRTVPYPLFRCLIRCLCLNTVPTPNGEAQLLVWGSSSKLGKLAQSEP